MSKLDNLLKSLAFMAFLLLPAGIFAQELAGTDMMVATQVELERSAAHYQRARALLISAIREFDQATAIASPDAIIDSDRFRVSLRTRAEELEKVLAPQPRAHRGGIALPPDPRLLNTKPSNRK